VTSRGELIENLIEADRNARIEREAAEEHEARREKR